MTARDVGETASAVLVVTVVGAVMGPMTLTSRIAFFVPAYGAIKLAEVVQKRLKNRKDED